MLTNAQKICTRALKLVGVASPGETPDPEDIIDAYDTVQEMLDGWRVDRLLVYALQEDTFNFVPGQQDYLIGPGGDFVRDRPVFLERASVLSYTNPSRPLELSLGDRLTESQWQGIAVKSTPSPIPTRWRWIHNIDGTIDCDLISFWPTPSLSTNKVKLYCPTPLPQFSSLTANYLFPPSYLRALRYNLAVELAIEFHRPMPDGLQEKAAEYLADIRRINLPIEIVRMDPALVGHNGKSSFNYRVG